MSDQLPGKSRLDAAALAIGHHNIAVLSTLPVTGFFPAVATSDVLFNRSTTTVDEGCGLLRRTDHHAPGIPIPDLRFVKQQQIDGMTSGIVSAIPSERSSPNATRISHFPSIIATPSSYSRRHDVVEVQLAAARMKEATSLLLWASMTPISPTFWPPPAAS